MEMAALEHLLPLLEQSQLMLAVVVERRIQAVMPELAELAVALPQLVASMGLDSRLLRWHVWVSVELCEYREKEEAAHAHC